MYNPYRVSPRHLIEWFNWEVVNCSSSSNPSRTQSELTIKYIHNKTITRLRAFNRNGSRKVVNLGQIHVLDIVARWGIYVALLNS